MTTGDPVLDNPDSRHVIETAYKASPADAQGLRREIGGSCTADLLNCATEVGGPRQVGVPIVENAAFEYHSHPNEGFVAGFVFEMPARPSRDHDIPSVLAEKNPFPMYVIARDFIYRVQYNPRTGNVDETTFNRWKP